MNRSRKTKEILICVLVAAGVLLATGRYARADFVFGTPENIGAPINTSYSDGTARVSADGLSLYFCSNRPGGSGSYDLWITTRATKDDDWGTPENLGPTVNSSKDEWAPSISPNGLELYFCSDRHGGWSGGVDIWVATRAVVSDPWGEPVNLGGPVNSSVFDAHPSISADGLSLFFGSNREKTGTDYSGYCYIYVTTRLTTNDPWSDPVRLGQTVNPGLEYDSDWPSISADGKILFFSSNRPGGIDGSWDLWFARRAANNPGWEKPVHLGPNVNSPIFDGYEYLSADGSTLYFDCERPGSYGSYDIWQVSIEPVVDFNGDGIVGLEDLVILIEYWGQDAPFIDVGPMPWGDGVVNEEDIEILLKYWGQEVDYPAEPSGPVTQPDSTGFQIYADQNTPDMFVSNSFSQGDLDCYDQTNPVEGIYCIYCTGVARYNHIGFRFWPERDLMLLV